ncbi:Apple domain-containing protein [Durusdinium trenchii]|uniref:Apple domain-containing protein n=1 Tax=Durusdinium trenchii TaxID=1381693 RepID=A0ABP0MQC3_9DINO
MDAIAKYWWDSSEASGQCGNMEKNLDYVEYSGWGTNLDHIPDPDMCCAFCQANPKCKSFVWVEDAGLPGNPSQCWLKGGEPVDKKPKDGVVAGIPPPRQPFQMVPQEASPDQFPVDRAGMFCFSLMLPFGYEVELLAWQYNQQVSIFACDKFAVYTNKSMEVGAGTGLYTHVVDSNLHCQVGGDSQSALNSWIFIAVWKKVLEDGYWREYPWTVKVDPDAVFLPLRARPILMQYYGEPYINNCRYGMHGPVEFFGQKAMEALNGQYQASYDGKAPKACVEKLHFGLWGEDMFMDQCLRKVLQVTDGQPPALAPELMCEAHCDCPEWIWCSGSAVSFHPFKSIASYKNCLANAFSGRENDIKGLSGPDGALQFWLKLGGLPNGADCRLSRGADGTWRYYEVTSQGNTSIGEATLKNGLGDIPEAVVRCWLVCRSGLVGL